MSTQYKRNYITQSVTCGATYVEVSATAESYLRISVTSHGLLVSIGHETPSDATSAVLHTNSAMELPTGVVGPIFVRSNGASDAVASIVSA